ncbi:hypothetical protein BTN49_2558 [Candidatus Enterovibrio escicola]|uniref:Uncharacterized protein n=1 Tax=Candidatus Enterovibrio escicola TaxID=1927127 RepID=A0A2A5T135_9GAMM|nr:hypothetical protein BTN49_2558 [Candidatus Enterovibrio escacola]
MKSLFTDTHGMTRVMGASIQGSSPSWQTIQNQDEQRRQGKDKEPC